MTIEALQFTLAIFKKYVNPLGDILRKQNLQLNLKEVTADIEIVITKPDQMNYDVARKHLFFFKWLILERM